MADAIGNGLLNELQLSVRYQSRAQGRQAQYTLNPLLLVQRGPIQYLVAATEPDLPVLMFAMHRIVAAICTKIPIRQVTGFFADIWIADQMQFGHEGEIDLVLVVPEWAAVSLAETPISLNQSIRET